VNGIKQSVRTLIASPRSTWLWSPLLRGRVCILTLHRFGDTGATAMPGIDLGLLDDILSRLRRDGYRFVDLHDLFKGARLPSRSVVFTVDDGYADFERGAEVFRRHACPVTDRLP